MAARIGEKVPGWVERLLIPTIESRVRSVVKDEFSNFGKVMDARLNQLDEKVDTRIDHLEEKFAARFDGLEGKFEARFETLGSKIDSLEQRFPVIQDLADIKARLALLEKNLN
jgi:hypothetical protein